MKSLLPTLWTKQLACSNWITITLVCSTCLICVTFTVSVLIRSIRQSNSCTKPTFTSESEDDLDSLNGNRKNFTIHNASVEEKGNIFLALKAQCGKFMTSIGNSFRKNVESLIEMIQAMTASTIQNRKTHSTIICSLFAICSLLTVMFVIVEHCLTFVTSIVNCNDLPIPVELDDSQDTVEFESCRLKLRHYYRISPLVIILLISTTLSHLKLTFRLLITLFYFATLTTLNIIALKSQFPSSTNTTQLEPPQPLLAPNSPLFTSTTSILFAMFYILVFFICDRHQEISSRLHQLWKAKLQVEQEDVETIGGINKILLENILPQHVAQHFLLYNCGPNRTLYHER